MDLILVLTYTAIVIVVFKVFRLPVTKWSVTTAAFGGVLLIGWIYISMAYFHPASYFGKSYFYSTPLAISSRGKVSEVYVHDDRPLKKGDPIFRIDPTPYKAKVDAIKAQLKLAEERLKEYQRLYKQAGGSLFDIERETANIDNLRNQLISAEFDLNNTLVVAPEDGHLIMNRITVGTMAGIFKISSLATFIPDDKRFYIAAYKPNGLQNVKVGGEAEIFFTAIPGKLFKARVKKIWRETEEGQLLPSATMIDFGEFEPGRIPVEFEILDDLSGFNIPSGSSFGATVYSEHLAFLGELRRILLGMLSWKNFINFEGE